MEVRTLATVCTAAVFAKCVTAAARYCHTNNIIKSASASPKAYVDRVLAKSPYAVLTPPTKNQYRRAVSSALGAGEAVPQPTETRLTGTCNHEMADCPTSGHGPSWSRSENNTWAVALGDGIWAAARPQHFDSF
jgi:hypothetical protein